MNETVFGSLRNGNNVGPSRGVAVKSSQALGKSVVILTYFVKTLAPSRLKLWAQQGGEIIR